MFCEFAQWIEITFCSSISLFIFGSFLVFWYIFGSFFVRFWFVFGSFLVWFWYILVNFWFVFGSFLVRFWCSLVHFWFVFGSFLVRFYFFCCKRSFLLLYTIVIKNRFNTMVSLLVFKNYLYFWSFFISKMIFLNSCFIFSVMSLMHRSKWKLLIPGLAIMGTKRIEYILERNLENPSVWILSVRFNLKGS